MPGVSRSRPSLSVDGGRGHPRRRRPRDRKPVRAHPQVDEEVEVALPAVVVVAGDVACVAAQYGARLVREVSQIDGPRPSSSTAPSIWYAAVAAPQRKPWGKVMDDIVLLRKVEKIG